MTTFAPSARPSGCAIAWATAKEIFVEIPCAGLPPYITRHKRTASGLAEALGVMVEHEAKGTRGIAMRKQRTASPSDHPKIRRPAASFTDDQRARARDAVRRLLLKGD